VSTAIVSTKQSAHIAKLESIYQALAECRTFPEVLKIHNFADTARDLARKAHLGRDIQNRAAEISLEASRKAGAILQQLNKSEGGRPSEKTAASVAGVSEYAQTLADTLTPERTAQHWQTLADIPEESFTAYIQQSKDLQTEITQAGLLKSAKKAANRKCPTPVVSPDPTPAAAGDEALNFINGLVGPMSLMDTLRVYVKIIKELTNRVIDIRKTLQEKECVS
jgi:hypothetical protein